MSKYIASILFCLSLLLATQSVQAATPRGTCAKVKKTTVTAENTTAKIQHTEDNGLLITVGTDGTEYICDMRHNIAFIRKDGVVIDQLQLGASDSPSSTPVAHISDQQNDAFDDSGLVGK